MEICKICLKKISGAPKELDYHKTCLSKLFGSASVSPVLQFNRNVFKTELQKYTKGMSISGVQTKLSLKIVNSELHLTNTGGQYILKPTVEHFPQLSENEQLSMLIGRELGIETPPLGLVKFSDGELIYLIKRFDGSGQNKIQIEDMTQIFNLNRNDNENQVQNYKYSKTYQQVGIKLHEIVGGKMSVVLSFFNRLVYNYLIQNGDYHLKNISVQAQRLTKNGRYDELTPNYDSVMTRLYFPQESELALDLLMDDAIPKEYQHLGFFTRPDFEELGLKLGLPLSVTEIIFKKIKKQKKEILELVENSFLESTRKKEYASHLTSRMKKLRIMP